MIGYVVLDDGTTFQGFSFGAEGEAYGEAVFMTGMTGYQEALTDPSYHRQILVMTAPHIGNTGMNSEDEESERIWVAGLIVRNLSPRVSNWRSEQTLEAELKKYGVIGISGVDTRAMTRHLRSRGVMRAGLFSGEKYSKEEMVVKVRNSPLMAGRHLADEVSTKNEVIYRAEPRKFRVAALDLGIKKATPLNMASRGIEVTVLPFNTSYLQIKERGFDGLFLSNGPGDPASMNLVIDNVRAALSDSFPIFGICFGHQILGRALGFDTYKLRFGHRGINQPVFNKEKNRVEITSHNHGFAVDAPIEDEFKTVYGSGKVTHICLNDNVVEGLRLLDRPAFSVQYHPEAAAGPHDANYLFDQFLEMLENHASP
jgi:carbamoyl-phosphate synthase small subunit